MKKSKTKSKFFKEKFSSESQSNDDLFINPNNKNSNKKKFLSESNKSEEKNTIKSNELKTKK